MAYEGVAFLSDGERLTEREKALVNRMINRVALFLVLGSERKSELLKEYVCTLGNVRMNIVTLRNEDSDYLLPYLARETSTETLLIDITFASPFYASAVTLLAIRSTVSITYTNWDGSARFLNRPRGSRSCYDGTNSRIVTKLADGPLGLTELSESLEIPYATTARRASQLLADGAISRTEDYPIRYFVTDEQLVACALCRGPFDRIQKSDRMFLTAAEAFFSENKVVLDTSIPPVTVEFNLETGEIGSEEQL